MTDKEKIMIDAVNVGQCKYLNTFTDCDGYHYYCDLADDIKNEYCEHYKNCYFKQLQKEKFENLNNRQIVESAENLIYENSELYRNIKEKEQECERLKSYGATLLADKNAMEIGRDDYMQRCKRLEQECEELKEQLMETKTFDLFADKLIEKFNTDSAIASIFKNNTRYLKALEEIERELKEDIYCESQECGCDDYEECLRCTKNIILDIISKAKGE